MKYSNPLLLFSVVLRWQSKTFNMIEARVKLKVASKGRIDVSKIPEEKLADWLKAYPVQLSHEIYEENKEMFESTPFDALAVLHHGGFRCWEASYGGFLSLESKPISTTLTQKELVDSCRELGESQFLKSHNLSEHRKILRYKSELATSHSVHQNEPEIIKQIDLKLFEYDQWLGAFAKWFLDNGVEIPRPEFHQEQVRNVEKPHSVQVVETSEQDKDTMLRIAQQKAVEQRNKIIRLKNNLKLKNRPTKDELFAQADKVRFRTTNKINYSKLGESFGVTNQTAKKWCRDYGIE